MTLSIQKAVHDLDLHKGSIRLAIANNPTAVEISQAPVNEIKVVKGGTTFSFEPKIPDDLKLVVGQNELNLSVANLDNLVDISYIQRNLDLTKEIIAPQLVKIPNNVSIQLDTIIENHPTRVVVSAYCDASDSVKDLVYIYANKVGDYFQVRRVDPTNLAKMPAWGVVLEKYSPTICKVQLFGEMPTSIYTGLTANKILYVGTNSRLTQIPPSPAIGGYVLVQYVGYVLDSSVPFLNFNAMMIRRFG